MCQPKEPHSLDFLSAAGRPKTRERSGGCGGYRQLVVLTAEGKAPHEEDGAASPHAVKPLAVLRAAPAGDAEMYSCVRRNLRLRLCSIELLYQQGAPILLANSRGER